MLTGPVAQAGGVALSADGRTLYTYSLDGVVLGWDLAADRGFGRRFRLGPGVRCCAPVCTSPAAAVSPDGSRLAIRLGASTVGLFSTSSLQRQASFTVGPAGALITALALSPTSPEPAVAGYSGLPQPWNVVGPPGLFRTFAGFKQLVKGWPEAIQSVAFSLDADSSSPATRAKYSQRREQEASALDWRIRRSGARAPGTLSSRQKSLQPAPREPAILAVSRHGGLLAVTKPSRIHP